MSLSPYPNFAAGLRPSEVGARVEVPASAQEATIANVADVPRHYPMLPISLRSLEHGAHVKDLVSVDFFTVPTVVFRSCSFSWCWRMIAGAFSALM